VLLGPTAEDVPSRADTATNGRCQGFYCGAEVARLLRAGTD
jgi:hypothetical protein